MPPKKNAPKKPPKKRPPKNKGGKIKTDKVESAVFFPKCRAYKYPKKHSKYVPKSKVPLCKNPRKNKKIEVV